ncbi:2492_t:CDS:2, partial [Scutellospora calospora]
QQISCLECSIILYLNTNFCHKCSTTIKLELLYISQSTKNIKNMYFKNLVDKKKQIYESRIANQIETHKNIRSNIIFKKNKNNIITNITTKKNILVKLLYYNLHYSKGIIVKNAKTYKTKFNIKDLIEDILKLLLILFEDKVKRC